MTSEDASASARAAEAFEHAVDREISAIETHKKAAELHRKIAADTRARADREHDPGYRDVLRTRADNEQERARSAESRAEHARERLREDGVEPPN